MPSADLRPDSLDLSLYKGDAWSVEVTARAPAPVGVVGAVLNLTGYTIVGRIIGESGVPIALTITNTNLIGGIFHFGQSAAANAGRYDIQLTPPTGLPRTYLRGIITVMGDVTP